jgi:hypothetical protein
VFRRLWQLTEAEGLSKMEEAELTGDPELDDDGCVQQLHQMLRAGRLPRE